MADDLDRASDLETAEREAAITAALLEVKLTAVHPRGACHNCEEPLPPGRSFCDADCGDDYFAREKARRQRAVL